METPTVSVTTSAAASTFEGSIINVIIVVAVIALVGAIIGTTLYTMSLISANTAAINQLSSQVKGTEDKANQSSLDATTNSVALLSATVTQMNNTLTANIATKADQSTVAALAITVAGKADQSTVTSLTTRVTTLESLILTKADQSTVTLLEGRVDALETAVPTKVDKITNLGLTTNGSSNITVTNVTDEAIVFNDGIFIAPVTAFQGSTGAMTINTPGFYLFEFLINAPTFNPPNMTPYNLSVSLIIIMADPPFDLVYRETFNFQDSVINSHSGFGGSGVTFINGPINLSTSLVINKVTLSNPGDTIDILGTNIVFLVRPR